MKIPSYRSLDEFADALMGGDLNGGFTCIFDLEEGMDPQKLRAAAQKIEDMNCCGANSGLGLINGRLLWAHVDFGH